MWKFKDSNKIIGNQMKIDSFKRHLISMQDIKPRIKIQTPWTPTFSLSKRKNKYYKITQNSIDKQNQNLLKRMIQIQSQPMVNTLNVIPTTIPSNKTTHAQYKNRQRCQIQSSIYKQNQKIYDKIQSALSLYRKQSLDNDWKENRRYISNLKKKQYISDYGALAKSTLMESRVKRRPATAMPR